jgi:hypothetical protein
LLFQPPNIDNSEVGISALKISAFYLRIICTECVGGGWLSINPPEGQIFLTFLENLMNDGGNQCFFHPRS